MISAASCEARQHLDERARLALTRGTPTFWINGRPGVAISSIDLPDVMHADARPPLLITRQQVDCVSEIIAEVLKC